MLQVKVDSVVKLTMASWMLAGRLLDRAWPPRGR
jgi:hypothetical protein